MDGRSQVRLTVALVVRTATWLRGEEAAGSNPATRPVIPARAGFQRARRPVLDHLTVRSGVRSRQILLLTVIVQTSA
jgi:hypothetical protein